jgi:cation diffusion facilitator family transporter
MNSTDRGIRAAQAGLLVNAGLVVAKLLAGLLGNSSALGADAVESSTDLLGSMVVWRGLRITTKPADESYPYGYGKAEPLAAAVVSLMLIGAAASIALVAIREIPLARHSPAPFTLVVLAVVVVFKEVLFRRVVAVGNETGSLVVQTDAWHHRSDAITSGAAFLGIAVAIWGGPGWEAADDYAALAAAGVIAFSGIMLVRPAVADLMDRQPNAEVIATIEAAARGVDGVLATEKLRVRKFGTAYFVDIHVQADPGLSLREAHVLSGKVKSALRAAVPAVSDASIHMEPYEAA